MAGVFLYLDKSIVVKETERSINSVTIYSAKPFNVYEFRNGMKEMYITKAVTRHGVIIRAKKRHLLRHVFDTLEDTHVIGLDNGIAAFVYYDHV